MANLKLDLSRENIISCVIFAIIGLLLIILQGGSLGILMTIVGVLFIAYGIVNIFLNKNTIEGIIEIALGVAIILCGWLIASVVLLIFGIILVVFGINEIVKNYKYGFKAMLSPIVTIIIGILLIVAKWTLLDVLCIIAGIVFLIDAVLMLFEKSIINKK